MCVATELPLAAVEAAKRLESRENALGDDLRKAWVAINLVIMIICFVTIPFHSSAKNVFIIKVVIYIMLYIFSFQKVHFTFWFALEWSGLLHVTGKSSS